jgi:hypothetical protein
MNVTFADKDKTASDGIKNKLRDQDVNEIKAAVATKIDGDLVVFDTTLGSNIITLDMNNQAGRFFKGNANIVVAKTWAFANYGNARYIPSIRFHVAAGVPQTFPNNVKMPDNRWNNATKQWTAFDPGDYEATASYDGANWIVKISDVM